MVMLLLQLLQLHPGKGNNNVPQGIPKVLNTTSAKKNIYQKKMLEIILSLQQQQKNPNKY